MHLELSQRMHRCERRLSLPDIFGSAQSSAILGTTHVLQKVLCLLGAGSYWDMAQNAQKIQWNSALQPPCYYDHILLVQT